MNVASDKHKELQEMGIHWLYGIGCSIFAKEVPTGNGIADVLGIKTKDKKQVAYYLEAKVSRSDLLSEKQRLVYRIATGDVQAWCFLHNPNYFSGGPSRSEGWESCKNCIDEKAAIGDTGVDFYYLIVADTVKVDRNLYPKFGVLDERGNILRRARRMKRTSDVTYLVVNIAHVLVYKVFGKLYLK